MKFVEFMEKFYKEYLEYQKLFKNVIYFIQYVIFMISDLIFIFEVNFIFKNMKNISSVFYIKEVIYKESIIIVGNC